MENNRNYIIFSIFTLVALFIRFFSRDVVSPDMSLHLLPWFEHIKSAGGFTALNQQVGDYGLLYQTIIAFFTYFTVDPVYLYKVLSVLFDFLLALSIAFFVNYTGTGTIFKKNSFSFSYAYVILLPTVVMNSSFWGQCDSVYTFFLLWSIWLLYKEKFATSFFLLGCALSFKLQTVLIAPLFVFYYFCVQRFSLFNPLITVITFWFSGFVTYIYGRGLLEGINIYLFQIGEYKNMWMNVPSFWVLLGNNYEKFHLAAIFLTFTLLILGLILAVIRKINMNSFEQFISVAVFVEWACILFLPAMHERYTYVLDLLLLMQSFINKKYIKYTVVAIGLSCLTYHAFLFSQKVIISPQLVIVYLFAWLHYTYYLFFSAEQ